MERSGKPRKDRAQNRKGASRGKAPEPAEAALIIFAKAPIPGQVKTRLCPPLAPDEAATLHGSMVMDTLERCRHLIEFDRYLACAPSKQHPFFKAMEARMGVHLIEQITGDLGGRMNQACQSAFDNGYKSVIIIGTDLPTVDSDIFRTALQALANHDVVIGPSVDGGYYLIGSKKLSTELFSDIPWSTDQVLTLTQQKVQGLGLSLKLLAQQRDLDTISDLHMCIKEAQGPGKTTISSRTAQVIKTLAKRLTTRE